MRLGEPGIRWNGALLGLFRGRAAAHDPFGSPFFAIFWASENVMSPKDDKRLCLSLPYCKPTGPAQG
jgi:hypothetical protein